MLGKLTVNVFVDDRTRLGGIDTDLGVGQGSETEAQAKGSDERLDDSHVDLLLLLWSSD
jgi:hypothetical protein